MPKILKTTTASAKNKAITERKRAEAALLESEEIFHLFMKYSPIYVYFKDENIKAIRLSENFTEMLGRPMSELLGKSMDDLFPSDFAKGMVADDKRVLKEGKKVEIEEEMNGRVYSTIKFPVYREGKPTYLAGFSVDITERKRAEEMIRKSNERFHLAINATEDGLWEWDIKTNQEFFAPRWCEIIGYSVDDPELPHTFKSWASRIHPDDYDHVMGAMNNHLKNGAKYDVDYRHRHKSGEYRWQNSKGQAVFDESGKPAKMIGCISDITERKLMQAKLLASEKRLASEKLDVMGRLIADVSHEINNPLAIITLGIGRLEMIYEKQVTAIPDSEDKARMLEKIKNATNRCKKIVAALLVSTRSTTLDVKPTDINKVIEESLESMDDHLKSQDVKVVKAFAPRLPVIEADGHRLGQVFINLFTNACDAMPEGGKLRIATRLHTPETGTRKATGGKSPASGGTSPAIEIEISDTGEGIEEDDIFKIFDPFVTTKKDGKGVGLGLSISSGIVREHGGDISVTSKKGKGATFIIRLPVKRAQAGDNGA